MKNGPQIKIPVQIRKRAFFFLTLIFFWWKTNTMCLYYITQILRLFARNQNIFKQNKEGTFTGKLSIPFLESSSRC